MEEIFRTVKGFEDYQVSNLGRVITNKNGKNKFLKPQQDGIGYFHVRLYTDDERFGYYVNNRGKKPKLYKVHKLVAETFLDIPTDIKYLTVNHKNGIKSDNALANLEWMSLSDNLQHSWDNGSRDNSAWKAAPKRYRPLKVTFPNGEEYYYKARKYAIMDLGIRPNIITLALKSNNPVKKGKWQGYKFEDCELPLGETYKRLLDIESKLLEYSKYQDYFRNKNRERRNNKRKNND